MLVGLLLLLCVCHGKNNNKKANLTKNQQLAILWGLIRLERSLSHRTEVIGITECMRWSGLLLVLANPWCLLYAELSGSFGSEIYWTSPPPTFRRLRSSVCLYRVINVYFIFIQPTQERMDFWSWSLTPAWCPPSPPSLLCLPYLPPLFLRQPSCSALMRGHPQLLEWRKGDTEKKRKHISQQFSSQACKLILFLLPFTFFQCDFSGSGWVEFTFIVTC